MLRLAIIASILLALPTKALAERTCNYTNDVIWMAHAQYVRGATWGSWGWWSIEPGKCGGEKRPDRYTYIVYKRDGSVTPPRQYSSRPSTNFCVKESSFEIFRADDRNECRRLGGRMETFLNYGLDTEVIN